MTLNQKKRRQPHVPTQRLAIAVRQRKEGSLTCVFQRHAIASNHRKKTSTHAYSSSKKKSLCIFRRDKYALSEPKSVAKDAHIKDLESSLLRNTKVKSKLIKSF